MSVLEIISGILMLISSIFIILLVMGQESKQGNGLEALSGDSNSDSYMGKTGGGRTREAYLAKLTKYAAIVFFVVSIALNVIVHFNW